MSGFNQGDINRLAHEAQLRFPNIVGVEMIDVENIEHHPEVVELSGRLAVIEAQQEAPPQLFGYDDTDEFRRAVLGTDAE